MKLDMISAHPYMGTFSGEKLYPEQLTEDQINIIDIANGLGREARFGNQADRFYSVAQHSVLLATLVPDEYKLWAMLHDASEAYTHDIPKPLKRCITGWTEFEHKLSKVIYEHFGLEGDLPAAVKDVDDRIVIDEAMVLFNVWPEWARERKADATGVMVRPWGRTVSRYIWLRYMYQLLGTQITDTEVARQLRIETPLGKTYRNPLWVS